MSRLENKVAIVTGASSGVGLETAKLFAKEGAKVVLVARRYEILEQLASEIKSAGGEATAVACDLRDAEQVKNAVDKCVELYGKVDILANVAGVNAYDMETIEKTADLAQDSILETNINGYYYMANSVLRYMIPAEYGAIVNVASVAGEYGYGDARYVLSKGAVIAMSKHIAMLFNTKHIRSNTICPATIVTPMIERNLCGEGIDMDLITAMSRHTDSMAEPNMPEDIAQTILFLASDESKNITGQTIVADYGYSL